MSILSEGFKFGNININKEFIMTKTEMETLGNADGYPDVFPIWCKDDRCLYIFYRSTDGIPNIVNYSNLITSHQTAVMYPMLNPDTNEISWEIRELTDEVPDPVVLNGAPGKSAYEVWLEIGNEGSEQDFLNSLKPDLSTLNNEQINSLKTQLGLDTLEESINALNKSLNNIID